MEHFNKVDSINQLDKIFNCLKKYGFCVVDKYIAGSELTNLIAEYESVFKNSNYQRIQHPGNKEGLVYKLSDNEIDKSNLNSLKNCFYNDMLKNIANSYYSNGCNFNSSVFLTHEKEDPTPILPWHHDRIQALKFYINIKDVTKNDGAFEYVPGSHRYGYYRANYYIATGCPIEDIPNDVPDDEIINPVTLEVDAGDLIIFDADGIHRGGYVKPGHERKVIRAHTNPLPYLGYSKPRILTKEWLLRTPLNFAKLFEGAYGRIISERFKPGASQGKYRD